jgi:hypothetical protein
MSSERTVFWLTATVLLGCGVLVGQIAAVSVAAASGAVLAYRNYGMGSPEVR